MKIGKFLNFISVKCEHNRIFVRILEILRQFLKNLKELVDKLQFF